MQPLQHRQGGLGARAGEGELHRRAAHPAQPRLGHAQEHAPGEFAQHVAGDLRPDLAAQAGEPVHPHDRHEATGRGQVAAPGPGRAARRLRGEVDAQLGRQDLQGAGRLRVDGRAEPGGRAVQHAPQNGGEARPQRVRRRRRVGRDFGTCRIDHAATLPPQACGRINVVGFEGVHPRPRSIRPR